ncbi:MAG TPA: hypothetical protein VGL57_04930 [Solirubrobacteraceae bacterium]
MSERHGKESAGNAAPIRSVGRIVALFAALVVSLTITAAASADVSFIKAYGWGVADGLDQFETCTSTCQAGIGGGAAGQLGAPGGAATSGIATDRSGDVYVPDEDNERIDEFSAAGEFIKAYGWGVADGASQFETCTTTCQTGIPGPGAGQFDGPASVATDSSGDVYVADSVNYRIDEFSAAGAFIKAYGWGVADGASQFETCTTTCQTGIYGGGAGQFGPASVATDSSGDVYVADPDNDRIDEFSAAGAFMKAYGWGVLPGANQNQFETCTTTCQSSGFFGGGAGQFGGCGAGQYAVICIGGPSAVATDSSGDVYAVDAYNNRIDEFSGSVAASTLTQGPPTSATVTDGAGYSGQLTVTNATGTASYTETASADSFDVDVHSDGAISAADTLTPGTYMVGGSDSDTAGDTGSWSFMLTVTPKLVLSGTVENRYGKAIPSVAVVITGASGDQTVMTNGTGLYSAMVDPGTYAVTPQPINPQSDDTYEPQASSDCAVQGTSCVVTLADSDVEDDFDMPQLPVVLVTGLSDSHPGTSTPGQPCASVGSAGVGSMETLCSALQTQGFPVYVPSSSAGPGAVINNGAGVAVNAASLAQYLSTTVGGPALLVGHSMGGLFSRDAIARDGAQAAGLFTIGTPFDGSFGADIDEGAANFPCSNTVGACLALHVAARAIAASLGSAAIADLTSTARAADDLTLGAPGVPTWTFAGIACDPTASPGYVSPNDGIVGEQSAFGLPTGIVPGANLGHTTQLSPQSDYHSASVQGPLETLGPAGCGDHGIELTDPYVVEQVLHAAASLNSPFTGNETRLLRFDGLLASSAAASLDSPFTGNETRLLRFDGLLASSAAAKRRPVVLYMQAASMQSLKPGAKVPVAAGTSLLSRTPFAINCGKHTVQALSAFGSGVFGFMPAMLACQHATLSAGHAISVGIATDPDRVTATIVNGRKNGFTITVAAARAITRLVLTRGKGTLRVGRHRLGRRTIRITVTVAQASGLTLTATVEHSRYAATINALR